MLWAYTYARDTSRSNVYVNIWMHRSWTKNHRISSSYLSINLFICRRWRQMTIDSLKSTTFAKSIYRWGIFSADSSYLTVCHFHDEHADTATSNVPSIQHDARQTVFFSCTDPTHQNDMHLRRSFILLHILRLLISQRYCPMRTYCQLHK